MAILQRVLIKSDMAASLCFPVPPAPPAERCRHRRGAVPQGFKAADGSPCPERRILMNGGQSGEGSHCKTPFSPLPQQGPARIKFLPAQRRCGNRLSAPCPLYRFYQYILPLYAVTWVAFSFTELIVSISSLPVLPSNRRVNRIGWSKGGFINTALLST